MKNIKFILLAFLVAFASCEPLEVRQSLESAPSVDQFANSIDVSVSGNTVTCTTTFKDPIMQWESTSGVIGSGSTFTFDAPLLGDYKVKATLLGYDKAVVVDDIPFNIPADDPVFFAHEYWDLIADADGDREKTWVWAPDNTYKPGMVWGNGPFGSGAQCAQWWTVTMDWLIQNKGATAEDEITFKMAGLEFDTHQAEGGNPGSGAGTWILDTSAENAIGEWSKATLKFTGHTLPCGIDGGDNLHYEFRILLLTETDMTLAVKGADGNGWYFHWKAK